MRPVDTAPMPPTIQETASRTRPRATWREYVAIARPDHWVKHIFILPGTVLAWLLLPTAGVPIWRHLVVGLLSAGAVASANYVLNEWLDAEFDAHHPTKSARPAVATAMSPALVGLEYLLLAAAGLAAAWQVGDLFFWTSVAFLASGLIYNVRPLRTKERAYLDVLTEALNNPIRLTLGWAMVSSTTFPPGSILLAYWMGGAFLMAVKRFAEYRTVAGTAGIEALERYRRSFRAYTEESLLLSAFLYALMASFFVAVFLIKYRIEYLLTLPFIAALFVTYLHLGLRQESSVEAPEKLYKEPSLLVAVAALAVAFLVLTFLDLPLLEHLTEPHYIEFLGR